MSLSLALPPMLFALFAWWFSTGIILFLDGLPRATYGWSMTGGVFVLGFGLYGLWSSRFDLSVAGSYCACTSALLVWGFHEMSFLMGVITGPRKVALPEGSVGLQRLGLALSTIIYHEVALAATAGVIALASAGASNKFGLWTYLLLWALRISAKLNVFLGVANLSEDFLPVHLRYLASYFRRAPMNGLFPISVTASSIATMLLLQHVGKDMPGGSVTGFGFLAALCALGVLEHWFMVLPLPTGALWAWGMKSHRQRALAKPREA